MIKGCPRWRHVSRSPTRSSAVGLGRLFLFEEVEPQVCQFQIVSVEGFTPWTCAKTVPESSDFISFRLAFERKQIPDLLETLVVKSEERSCWNRFSCGRSQLD